MRRWSVVKRPMCSPYSPTQQLTPHAPQHIPKSPPRTTPTPAPTRTACPPAPRTIPTPHHRPIHPRAPRHAPLLAVQPPARLLPQPKPALQPPKPHLPTLPQLQQQQLQRHRQLPAPLARRNRVYPKRHRRARLASLGALVMPPRTIITKNIRSPHPPTRTRNLHQQAHRTPPHHKRHPSPAPALLPLIFGRPHGVALHPPTPPPRRRVLRQGAPTRVLARAHAADRVRQLQRAQRFGVAPPVADT
jgi:hypothetical protein